MENCANWLKVCVNTEMKRYEPFENILNLLD